MLELLAAVFAACQGEQGLVGAHDSMELGCHARGNTRRHELWAGAQHGEDFFMGQAGLCLPG